MNIESLRDYVLTLPEVMESFPFGDSTLVFKHQNKIFLLVALDAVPLQFNVKCEPGRAIELREEHPESVLPGFHMNKKHWNTVIIDGRLKDLFLRSLITDSYHLVGKKKKI